MSSLVFVLGIALAFCASVAGAAQVLVNEDFDKIADGQLPTGWTSYDGKWEVKNGKLVGTSPNSSTLSRIVFGESSWHNVEISAKLTYTWAKDNKRWASLMHHVQPNGGPPYSQLAIRQGTTAANGVEIAYRNPSPGWNVWVTAANKEDFQLGVQHTAKVVVYNGKVWGFIDGVSMLELTDAVKEASGQVGLNVCGLTVEFDDVVVKSIDASDIAAMGLGAAVNKSVNKQQLAQMPSVIAHRGASAVAPENTATAFAKAVELGSNLIELDVQVSRDGQLIVIHDAKVDRTAKGPYTGNISNLTLTQIKTLDAGSWKGAQFAGEKVQTLEEVLNAFRGKATFLIEIKVTGIEAQVAAAIKNTDMIKNVVVQSFSADTIRKFRIALPEVLAGVLFNDVSFSDAIAKGEYYAKQTLAVNGQFAAIAHAAITPELVKQIELRGLPVYAWTVDDETSMRRVINAGVTGVITNYPDRVLKLLEAEYTTR